MLTCAFLLEHSPSLMSASLALVLDTQRFGITLYCLESENVVCTRKLDFQPYEMAVTPDNSTMYLGGERGSVIQYKVEDLSEVSELPMQTAEGVECIDVAPSGEYLATGGRNIVGLYALPSLKQLVCRNIAHGGSHVISVRFNPTSEYLVVGFNNHGIGIYGLPTLDVLREFASPSASQGTYSIAFVNDHHFISGCELKPCIWDASNGSCIKELPTHQLCVYGVAVSPERTYCAARSFGVLRVYTTSDYSQIAEFKRGPATIDHNITGACFLTESVMLLGMEDEEVIEWDIHTGDFRKKHNSTHKWPKIIKPLHDNCKCRH